MPVYPVLAPSALLDLKADHERLTRRVLNMQARVRAYMIQGGGNGGASRLARADAQIPKRISDNTPDSAWVQPLKYGGPGVAFQFDGEPIQVLSWVNSPSANPALDDKGFIYVWIEQGTDGQWYWTGEDCPVVDPGEPITEQPDGGTIPDNSNTIIVT